MRYRIDISYVGTSFQGWQSQANGQGVQDYVEHALSIMLRDRIRAIGSARTDSGVHAENQVAVFETNAPFDQQRWLGSLNGILPKTIGIKSIQPAASDFHPVYAAKGKAYRYRLWLSAQRNPFVNEYCWQLGMDLDIILIKEALKFFVGRHDFSSFCAKNTSAKTRERTIFALELECRQDRLVDIWVLGDGFLKQMVRTMVGTLVDVGRGRLTPQDITSILEKKNRACAGETAPPQGLCLVNVFYNEIPQIGELIALAESGFSFNIF